MRNSDWEHALKNSALAEREKRQHRVIIRWFSAYCRKQHPPAPPGRELANEFDRNVLRERKREDWQLAQWRAGLRWFLEYLGERPRSLTAPPDREPHGEAAGGPRGGAPVSEAAQ
ncbi:MAG: hypothetical protein O2960_22200 [Verrucomicrobia bacterium]|nr:hypothetical protein [Verrucomicrobiota bacterium]